MSHASVRTAVIPVAGLGTRFLPITKGIPKELLPIINKPVIEYIVEELVQSGIGKIIFVVSENKKAIQDYFSKDAELEDMLRAKNKTKELALIEHLHTMADFFTVTQHAPLGLGHAVLQAESLVGNEPFIVCCGDDIVDGDVPAASELIRVYDQHHTSVVGVVAVPQDAVSRYGIIQPIEQIDARTWKISDIIEKPSVDSAPSTYAVGGRWLLTPEIFAALSNTKPGAGGEIQLTDALRALVQKQPLYAHAFTGIYRDCGNTLEYIKAIIAFALRDADFGDDVRAFIRNTGSL